MGSWVRSGLAPRPLGTVAWVVVLLGVRNVGEVVLPAPAYVPTNVAVGALLLLVARRSGSSWEDLGLGGRRIRRGLTVGAVAGGVAIVAMLLAAALPMTRGFFNDARVPAGAPGWERLYQTVIRIPLGTVLFEELAFRGVLLAVLCRHLRLTAAVGVSSALFGLWHIVPTLSTATANGIEGPARVGLVAGSVLATAVGGLVFCALRVRGRHILAPALLHLAFNDLGYLIAWWVRG
ncbi:MAG: CPBP family intramembrane metalloprotease [Actinomycetota bacterium]|nr:CPBP family intramembrane metalloprotease [Actinomycetota bacterium]